MQYILMICLFTLSASLYGGVQAPYQSDPRLSVAFSEADDCCEDDTGEDDDDIIIMDDEDDDEGVNN